MSMDRSRGRAGGAAAATVRGRRGVVVRSSQTIRVSWPACIQSSAIAQPAKGARYGCRRWRWPPPPRPWSGSAVFAQRGRWSAPLTIRSMSNVEAARSGRASMIASRARLTGAVVADQQLALAAADRG